MVFVQANHSHRMLNQHWRCSLCSSLFVQLLSTPQIRLGKWKIQFEYEKRPNL
ncbi:hypothetical protein CsSME_00035738 [Camellia sinensis var. sinensis]